MEQKLEPFTRHGIAENRIEVSADEIMEAIAEGREVFNTRQFKTMQNKSDSRMTQITGCKPKGVVHIRHECL